MPIRATLILADSAQAIAGKLYILGAGWNITSGDIPSAVAVMLHVSCDLANTVHEWQLELIDSDDRPVMVSTREGEEQQAIVASAGLRLADRPDFRMERSCSSLSPCSSARYCSNRGATFGGF
jgi:hypothetical protein